jgi:hypothetical protein
MPNYAYLNLDTTPPTLQVIAPSIIKEDELVNIVITSNEAIDDDYEIYYLNDTKEKIFLSFDKINDRVLSGNVRFLNIKTYEIVILFVKTKDIVYNAAQTSFALTQDGQQAFYEIQSKEYNNEFFSSEKPTDISDVLSSVFSVVKDLYLSFFEEGFFKTIRVKSKLESVTDFKAFMHTIPKMKEKPIIVFDADTIELVEDTIFTDNDLSRNPLMPGGESGSSVYGIPFLDLGDYVEGNTMGLLYRMNRYRVQTNILMVTSGRANQLNLYNHIIMNIRHKSMYTLKMPISCKLDLAHIINIAKILNKDVKSDEFLDLLNSRSIHPIRRLLRPNENLVFYAVMELNLHINIPAFPSIDTPGKNGMIEEAARLASGIIVEVDMPSMYQFVVSTEIMKDPVIGIITPGSPTYIAPITASDIPRITTDKYLNISLIDVMIEKPEDNTISLYDLFGESMKDLVNYLYKKFKEGVLQDYLDIRVYSKATVVNSMIDENFNLVVMEADPLVLYSIGVYINTGKSNLEVNDEFTKIIGTLKFDR